MTRIAKQNFRFNPDMYYFNHFLRKLVTVTGKENIIIHGALGDNLVLDTVIAIRILFSSLQVSFRQE